MTAMLQSRLMIIMQRELDSQNLLPDPYCTQQIERLVTQGVERMRNNNAADHPGRVMNAEQNLKSLVKYICDYSKNMGTFPQLSQSHFDAAMRSCPTLWPYCTAG